MVRKYNLYNNRVRNTVFRNEKSDRKQVKVDKKVYDVVSDMSDYSNKTYTQGIITYEYLMMYGFGSSDRIDDMEKRIDSKLDSIGVNVDVLNSVKWVKGYEFDESNESQRVNLYIPQKLNNDKDDSWSEILNDAVRYGVNTIYFDRFDRIEAKEQLYDYITYDKQPNNKRAKLILDNSDAIKIDGVLGLDYSITTKNEYIDIASPDDNWTQRFERLDNWHESASDIRLSKLNIVKLWMNAYNYDSKTYLIDKVREYAKEYGKQYLLDDIDVDMPEVQRTSIDYDDIPDLYDKHYSLKQIVYRMGEVDKRKLKNTVINAGIIYDDKGFKFWREKNDNVFYKYKSKTIVVDYEENIQAIKN